MIIRICERWNGPPVGVTDEERDTLLLQKDAIAETIDRWRDENDRRFDPLRLDRGHLRTRQWVGVVEVEGVSIEIYPKKLHRGTLDDPRAAMQDDAVRRSVMQSLLGTINVGWCGGGLARAGLAGLREDEELGFSDIFAYMLSHDLLKELEAGVAHAYQETSDDLQMMRGRIDFEAQITRNWNRLDRIACTWDEFTPNTSMNRLLKCACRALQVRTRHTEAVAKMSDCIALLEEVDDVSAHQALTETRFLRRDRLNDRYWPSLQLARSLLVASGPELTSGEFDTCTFLIDMDKLFESYVRAILRARFGEASVRKPKRYLLRVARQQAGEPEHRRMPQRPDFLWRDAQQGRWIGDAKYKEHLAKRAPERLRDGTPHHGVREADVRQLITYGELWSQGNNRPGLAIFYPSVDANQFEIVRFEARTPTNLPLLFVPVRVNPGPNQVEVANLIPEFHQ